MDNSFKTFLKHAFKMTTDYLAILFLFLILSYPIVSLAGDTPGPAVRVVSFLLFLALFALVYRDMHEVATREKRPQYDINPTPVRGLLLGLAGLVPVWLLMGVLYFGVVLIFPLPASLTLQLRLLQSASVPLYWLVSAFGGAKFLYPVLLPVISLLAAFGYWAGLRDLFLMQRFYKLIGYTPKKRVRKPLKKANRNKGFWGM